MKYLVVFTVLFPLLIFAGEMKSLKIGEEVPSFTLKNYDGKNYTIDSIKKAHQYTVMMFISTECPVSNAYNVRMVKLHESYSKKGVAFVGINSNKEENVKSIAQHAKKQGFKFLILKDDSNKVADAYGALVTPEMFVIDSKGKLLYQGRIDDNRNAEKIESKDLMNALDALLAGKEPTRTVARAFGCTIKRISQD